MKKHTLTDKQYEIGNKTRRDSGLTDWWLRQNGINAQYVANTDAKLVQAQQKAHTLLTQHIELLTQSQIKTLQNFKRKMNTGHIRKKLKPDAALPIFSIHTRIIRKLHSKSKNK